MKAEAAMKQRAIRIALLANCTIDLFPPYLTKACDVRHLQIEFWQTGYNQYRQAILDPVSDLYAFQPDFVLLYLSAEDLFTELLANPFGYGKEQKQLFVRSAISELVELTTCLADHLPKANLILNTITFPPLYTLTGLEYNTEYSLRDVINNYNHELDILAKESPSVLILDVEALVAWIGYAEWPDSRLWYLARARWSQKAMQLMASFYSASIASRLGLMKKCLVLDLDNTLWGGVIGEDGISGIKLGKEGIGLAFTEFQEELLNLNRKGILLAICSKNNPEDAIDAIRKHPSMCLKEEHFAAMRINWEDKATNISAIAEELNIGIESLVLVDDNPAERAWVSAALPEVFVPDWPTDPINYKRSLLELEVTDFYKTSLTQEDLLRAQLYRAQAKRKVLETTAKSLDDFYRSLEMQAIIRTATSFTIPRVAQLTQKTNQFNLTTRRYSESEIRTFVQDPTYLIYCLELKDRFGTNGVVGVLILRDLAAGEWIIDDFLLSCRVMGRTVENAFLGFASKAIRERGGKKLIGEYLPTEKNKPVAQLFRALGFRPLKQLINDGELWELELDRETPPIEIPEWITVVMEEDKDG